MTTTTPPAGYAELVARDQWVNAGRDKIPYTPSLAGEKKPACADDPATFRSFAEADAARAAGRFPHVGYEFTAGDPHFLIDLDHHACFAINPRSTARRVCCRVRFFSGWRFAVCLVVILTTALRSGV